MYINSLVGIVAKNIPYFIHSTPYLTLLNACDSHKFARCG